MKTRTTFALAATLVGAVLAVVRVTGDELPSKDHPSPEPFGDIQPFDLSKRETSTTPKSKDSTGDGKSSQPEKDQALVRHGDVANEILKVNDLGDAERIVFEGVKLFPEKQLRLALQCDLKYQAAARPSNAMVDFLATLEKRLTEGYAHSGCPDATVHASRDDKRAAIVVNVAEGARYRKGEIRISGSKVIDQQAVRDILTKPQRARAWQYIEGDKRLDLLAQETPGQSSADASDPVVFWNPGEAVDFRGFENSHLETGIRFALAELGFAMSTFRFEFERDEKRGLANLHISILHEAPQAVVGDVEVSGLKRDSREVLLKFLEVSPDDPLNGETLRRIDQRLSASCRYWTRKIEVSLPAADRYAPSPQSAIVKLSLKLEEFAPVPPLGEPLSPVDEILKRCGDWINSLAGDFGDRDLVCTAASADLGGLAQHAQISLAADGTVAIDAQLVNNGLHFDHSAVLGGRSIEIYDWQHNDKFCLSRDSLPILQIRTNAWSESDGKQDANLQLGYAFGSVDKTHEAHAMRCDVRVEPVVLLDIYRRRLTKAVLQDNVLTLSDDEVELQIDQMTGQIRSAKGASFLPAGISAIDIKSETNFVSRMVEKTRRRGGKFNDRCDTKQPILSGVTYALAQVERQPVVENSPPLRQILHLGTAVANDEEIKRVFTEVVAGVAADSDAGGDFSIPGHLKISAENLSEGLEYYTPFLADKLFPRGTWPWTYFREYAFWGRDTGETAGQSKQLWEREKTRTSTAHEFGPASCLMFANICQRMWKEYPEFAAESARIGLSDLSDEAFDKDVRFLTKGDRGLATICRAIVRNYRSLSDEDRDCLLEHIPATWRERLLKAEARSDSNSNESAQEAVRTVMFDRWHGGWKDTVEAQLRVMSMNVASNPEKDSATNK